ncbi:MAG: hypothetical protein JW839_21895 [Candidatus Lokiarchaeota archaeon]|nr:hypothetical protein [Candidatus Lokiarchaeota archaeon]
MIAKKIFEDQIYSSIVSLYHDKGGVDYEKVGKLIVEACTAIEAHADNEENIDPRDIVKNALLLILGLLHKDEPIDNYGTDFKNLPAGKVRKFVRDMQDIFP